jgi:hydrogenase-4 component E
VSQALYGQLIDLSCAVFLLCAVLVLWRRRLSGAAALLAAQGSALAFVVVIRGLYGHDGQLLAVAVLVGLLRAVALPALVRRALARAGSTGQTEARVNVAASLLAAAGLTLLAYAVTRPVVALAPAPATRAVPAGLAVVLIGFLVLVTRTRAISQVVGFLLVDNGITLVAFLTTTGVPLVVELGVSMDVLLAVLVLQVLTGRMRVAFGGTDLNELRELAD